MTTLREAAQRLVDHADFQLGGVLSADSKSRDIPSRAVSQVKARHLAALRQALVPPESEPALIGCVQHDCAECKAREAIASTESEPSDREALLSKLREAFAQSTHGEWQKGKTTHHTVTETRYRIAEFHHASDAQFCDTAHKMMPLIIDMLEADARPYADMYCALADAMGYTSGKNGMEFSPEEWAEALLKDATSYRLAQQVAVPQDKQADQSYVNGLARGYTLGHLGRDDEYRSEVAAYKREIAAATHQPPQGYAIVPIEPTSEMISAMSVSQAIDGEGKFPMLLDLIDFSGENKTHTVLKAAYRAMLKAAPQPPAYVPLTDDLVLLVWRLAASLRRAKPGSEITQQAIDFINSKGLTPSPLRQVGEQAVRGKT